MNGLVLGLVVGVLVIVWLLRRPERTSTPRPVEIDVAEVFGTLAAGTLAAAVVMAAIALFLLATPPPT